MSELDPQAAQLLELGRLNPAPPLESMGIVAARAAVDASLPMLALPEEAVAQVALHHVQGPAGSVAVRRYRPLGSEAGLPLPAVVFLHGGGWACCSVASHDSLCRYLCNRSGAEFVSVEYRLAPEHRFPAAIEDGLSVLDWLGRGSVDGIDRARLAVCGDSAGGNLAAVLAHSVVGRRMLRGQLLIYPVLDVSRHWRSFATYGHGYFLDVSTLDWFAGLYARTPDDRRDARMSPLLEADLRGVPPTCLLVPEFDMNRDEAFEYASRLQAAGVEAELRHYPQLPHGFASMAGHITAGCRALDEGAAALRRMLA